MTDTKEHVLAEERIHTIIAEMQAATTGFEGIGLGVSVFGSARIAREHPFYALAQAATTRIAALGVPVIAGGGPGLMEAANRGAYEAGGRSIGLNIRLPHETRDNTFQTNSLHFQYFLSRKATFFMHSLAYVVLPGGFGTLDEMFEAITLIQTHKHPPAPVILLGTRFWGGLMEWIEDQPVLHGTISAADVQRIVTLTDDLDEMAHCIEAAIERAASAPALPR